LRTQSRWITYETSSFRFTVDTFHSKRSTEEQRALIETFTYLGFRGPVSMSDADLDMCIFEEYERGARLPKRVHLARLVRPSGRRAATTFDLRKRCYISTTSMDAELALVTANLALARPGSLFYDPFMGTGGFPLACANFGAVALGSDIDGRSIRGSRDRNVRTNFRQYGLESLQLDSFVCDLTNSPMRTGQFLDGIVCDPPYGVREGLKVLGSKSHNKELVLLHNGKPAHLYGFILDPVS
jgi:tRNA (guanine10-N2)-methyltransferase